MKASASFFFIVLVIVTMCWALGWTSFGWWNERVEIRAMVGKLRQSEAQSELDRATIEQQMAEVEECQRRFVGAQEDLAGEHAAKEAALAQTHVLELENKDLKQRLANAEQEPKSPLTRGQPTWAHGDRQALQLSRGDLAQPWTAAQPTGTPGWPGPVPVYFFAFAIAGTVSGLGIAGFSKRVTRGTGAPVSRLRETDLEASERLADVPALPSSDLIVRMSRAERLRFLEWLESLAHQQSGGEGGNAAN